MKKTDFFDKISLETMRCDALIGVYPEERLKRRPIVLDIALFCDISNAARADDIAQAIDYSKVGEAALRIVRGSAFQLIESLAEAVAEAILGFTGVIETEVRLSKPAAIPDCENISVTIRRRR